MIAKQKDGTLVPYYTTKHNRKILMLRYGPYSIEQMFAAERGEVLQTAWKHRFAGFVALFFSSICLSTIIHLICMYKN